MDLNPDSRYFLQKISDHYDFAEGILFKSALIQLGLDYSLHSFNRIDHFFRQLSEKHPQPFDSVHFCQSPQNKNFVFTMAYYIGETIANHMGRPVYWYSRHQAIESLPVPIELPDSFAYSLVGMIDGHLCLPLGMLGEHLFERNQPMSFVSYAQNMLQRIEQDKTSTTQEWVDNFLLQFIQDQAFAGGMAYQSLLQKAELDFSMRSLSRLDILLRMVRRDNTMTMQALLHEQDKSNFALLAGFYMIEVTMQATGINAEWIGHDELCRLLDRQIPFGFNTSYACCIGENIYFPLTAIMEILFEPKQGVQCTSYIEKIIQTHSSTALKSS